MEWKNRGVVGGAWKRLLTVGKYLKKVRCRSSINDVIYYGEREFTFEKTPAFRSKRSARSSSMRFLKKMPCISPATVLFRDDDVVDLSTGKRHYYCYHQDEDEEVEFEDDMMSIDVRAEKFIASFYEQLKLQR